MSVIEEELISDSRNEIVRDLVVHMYAFVSRPSPSFCKEAAKKLVAAYPFMKDSGKGSGYVSFCYNWYMLPPFKQLVSLRDHGKDHREGQQF